MLPIAAQTMIELAAQSEVSQQERRTTRRWSASMRIEIKSMKRRVDGLWQPVLVKGQVHDLSENGLLVELSEPIPLSGRCCVAFGGTLGQGMPTKIYGRVVRCTFAFSGWHVALRLEEPIVHAA